MGAEHFVQPSTEIMPQLIKAATVIIAAVCSSPYHYCLSCYLKGESPHTGNFTVQLQYPITVQSTHFPFSNKATASSLQIFHASMLLSFSFFQTPRHWFVVFSLLTVHRKCVVAKQVLVTVSTPQRGPQN